MNDIILYSTGCPKCNVLKKKLDNSGVKYIEVTDIDIMTELGIDAIPVLKVNGELLSYMEAVKCINEGGLK